MHVRCGVEIASIRPFTLINNFKNKIGQQEAHTVSECEWDEWSLQTLASKENAFNDAITWKPMTWNYYSSGTGPFARFAHKYFVPCANTIVSEPIDVRLWKGTSLYSIYSGSQRLLRSKFLTTFQQTEIKMKKKASRHCCTFPSLWILLVFFFFFYSFLSPGWNVYPNKKLSKR